MLCTRISTSSELQCRLPQFHEQLGAAKKAAISPWALGPPNEEMHPSSRDLSLVELNAGRNLLRAFLRIKSLETKFRQSNVLCKSISGLFLELAFD
jgi:hypothetical protein